MRDATAWTELWVCFEPPRCEPPDHVVLLSFLDPVEEAAAVERWGARCLSGRALTQEIREEARAAYLHLVARLGTIRDGRGRTLRQALGSAAGVSRWWFFKLSEKDCVWDRDPTYTVLLRLFCVKAALAKYALRTVTIVGGDGLFDVLLGTRVERLRMLRHLASAFLRGVGTRTAWVVRALATWWACRGLPREDTPIDVLLEGHWDWSVRPADVGLVDRYFGGLPRRLEAAGVRVGWLATMEAGAEVWQRARSTRDVVTAAPSSVRLTERELGLRDIIGAALDVRAGVTVARFLLSSRARVTLQMEGFTLTPLIAPQLIEQAWGAGIPRWELLARATARICARTRPCVLLNFLELFLHSRALCAGARTGAPGVRIWTAQHAAYSSDKTFGVIDPRLERDGQPDGCAIPGPDGIFVMGGLAREFWLRNGFPAERVVVTGGLRYPHVRIEERRPRCRSDRVDALVVVGMNEIADLDMCQAVAAAALDLPIRLRLRNHPQYRLSERPGWRLQDRFKVTEGSVDGDLADTDVVLFTHSGLAEEALLRGIPVWQWLWAGFNTSVFLDLPVIPTFTSVAALRAAFESLVADPDAHRPARETQEMVLRGCFGPDPAAAERLVSESVLALLASASAERILS